MANLRQPAIRSSSQPKPTSPIWTSTPT